MKRGHFDDFDCTTSRYQDLLIYTYTYTYTVYVQYINMNFELTISNRTVKQEATKTTNDGSVWPRAQLTDTLL